MWLFLFPAEIPVHCGTLQLPEENVERPQEMLFPVGGRGPQQLLQRQLPEQRVSRQFCADHPPNGAIRVKKKQTRPLLLKCASSLPLSSPLSGWFQFHASGKWVSCFPDL